MQVHGYANRALFRQACSNIPKDVIVLEIGPHALLRAALRQNRPDLQYLYTMKRGESSVETLQDAIADLWLKGATVRWPSAETAPAAPCASNPPEPSQICRVKWVLPLQGLPCLAQSVLIDVTWLHGPSFALSASQDYYIFVTECD